MLAVTDRVSELVEPFTDRASAEKKIKAYRTELRRTLKRTERRGTTARRKATTERKRPAPGSSARRENASARSRRPLKKNRTEVEQRVRKAIDLLPV